MKRLYPIKIWNTLILIGGRTRERVWIWMRIELGAFSGYRGNSFEVAGYSFDELVLENMEDPLWNHYASLVRYNWAIRIVSIEPFDFYQATNNCSKWLREVLLRKYFDCNRTKLCSIMFHQQLLLIEGIFQINYDIQLIEINIRFENFYLVTFYWHIQKFVIVINCHIEK